MKRKLSQDLEFIASSTSLAPLTHSRVWDLTAKAKRLENTLEKSGKSLRQLQHAVRFAYEDEEAAKINKEIEEIFAAMKDLNLP